MKLSDKLLNRAFVGVLVLILGLGVAIVSFSASRAKPSKVTVILPGGWDSASLCAPVPDGIYCAPWPPGEYDEIIVRPANGTERGL